jgi:hypothetical protein
VGAQENDAVGRTGHDTVGRVKERAVGRAKGVLKHLMVNAIGHEESREQQAPEERRELTRRPAATSTAGGEEATWEWDWSGRTRAHEHKGLVSQLHGAATVQHRLILYFATTYVYRS